MPGLIANHCKFLFIAALSLLFLGLISSSVTISYISFTILPLLLLGLFFTAVAHRYATWQQILFLLGIGIILHVRNASLFSPSVFTDSKLYITWGKDFARGDGFPGMWYRAPLYPFLLGCSFLMHTTQGLQIMVLFQRVLTLADILFIYALAKEWNLSTPVALMSATLFMINSLVMQLSHAIMTESITLFLILASIFLLTRVFRYPGWWYTVLCSVSFAVTAYCRQIASPLFFAGLLLFLGKSPRKRLIYSMTAAVLFFSLEAPWCLRNLHQYGGYGLSYQLGPNIFTKLTSFRLADQTGYHYASCKNIIDQVEQSLGIAHYPVPDHPEDCWNINKIPHMIMDSLVQNHNYTPYTASSLLTAVSIEGFCCHPLRYAHGVLKTVYTLLFEQHEIPVKLDEIFSFTNIAPFPFRAILRTLAWVQGAIGLCVVMILLLQKIPLSSSQWIPFYIAGYGYLTTALIQVGFSRYTIPWIPFMYMNTAYVSVTVATFIRIYITGIYLRHKSAGSQ